MAIAAISIFITSAAVLGMGYGLRFFVDHGIRKGNGVLLNEGFALLLMLVLVLAAATWTRFYLVTWIGERVVADVRNDIYRRLISMHIGFFESTRTGELLSRLTADTTLLQQTLSGSISVICRHALMLTGGMLLLLITSWPLTRYLFLLVPLVVAPILLVGNRVRRLSREAQDRVAEINVQAEESFNAIRTVQALSLEEAETRRFSASVEAAKEAGRVRIQMKAMLIALVIGLVFGAIATVLWIGGHQVIAGTLSPGALSSFVFYAVVVAGSVGSLSDVLGDLQRVAGATERLMQLTALEAEITPPPVPHPLPQPCVGRVAFEGVSFSYPSRPEDAALTDIQFTVEPGETVALVGHSGAGKSTIIQLLLRFYDPGSGVIRVGGEDIRSLHPSALRSVFGVVPQDPAMFSTSAYANIACGKPEATAEEIHAAAAAAEAREFIEALPEGFGTYLGEKGVRLSGGQKQRIAIARAIVRNPAILLLDEATSALDAEHEQRVQHALSRLMRGRTTLVIAHRLATVRSADRILMLDKGKIQAIGTHEELLRSNELYARLAQLQFGQGTHAKTSEA
jgi:ATP-binding cassette subfamily B protein